MKIVDLLLDRLTDTALFEMAFSRKKARDKASDLQIPIAKHLIKILMFGNSSIQAHWIKETNTWLYDIQDMRIKNQNKPLNSKVLFQLLFEEPLGSIEDTQIRMNRAHNDYPDETITQPNATEVNRQLSWIYQNVCQAISDSQFKGLQDYLPVV